MTRMFFHVMQEKLLRWVRNLFLAGMLLMAGFLSCLTAMRYAIRGNEVIVPNLVGREVSEGGSIATAYSLRLKIDAHRYDSFTPKNRIISQFPSPDSRLKNDGTVHIILSLGAKRIAVPNLGDESLRAGQILLVKRGMTLGLTSNISFSEVEKDRIVDQDPSPDSEFALSPQMNLLVSTGRHRREYLMPDLSGESVDGVSKQLADLGLKLGTLNSQLVPGVSKGTILKFFPLAGTKLVEGSSVDIEIAR